MLTISRAMRAAASSLVLLGILLGQFAAGAQARRAGAGRQATQAAQPDRGARPPRQPDSDDAAQQKAKTLLSTKSRAMALAFESGKLPEPARLPPGGPDERAAALAKAVRAGDNSSTAALYAAVLAAGFGVRDRDGSVLQTNAPGQGLAFEAWEVAAMAKLYGEGRTVTLAYLCDALKSIPELKQAPLDAILIQGIRQHARGDEPLLRFWARFIVELGRQADEPFDLLGAADAKTVRLDAIQCALILRRLCGDFYGLAQRGKQGASRHTEGHSGGAPALRAASVGRMTPVGWRREPLFTRASLRRDVSPQPLKLYAASGAAGAQQGGPCPELGEGIGQTVLDAGAALITTGWGQLLDHLKAEYLGAEKYAKFLNIANVVLAYAKFVATYAALETEISVEDPPLVRTTNSVPGGRRLLKARVTMNTGKWDKINCFRTALNVATGLDMSLLTDGPLKGVEVTWHLDEGGGAALYHGGGGQIVGFWNGGPRIQDAGTYAGAAGQGGVAVGNATRSKTNEDGEATVYLEGSPHVPYVAPPYLPAMKRAVVSTNVRLKGGDIQGDAVDIAGQALGGLGALVSLPTELLYRTDWASTAELTVPVKDWETCGRGWNGTITVTGTLVETKNLMPGGPRGWILSKTSEERQEFEYKFILRGEKDTSEGFQNGYFANALSKIDKSAVQIEKATEVGFCNKEKVKGTRTLTNGFWLNGAGAGRTTVYIAQRGAEGYNILIKSPPPIPGNRQSKFQYDFPQCPLWEQVNSHSEGRPEDIYLPQIEFLATFDPKNPGVLSGGRTARDARGNGTVTYRWDLQQCK